MDKGSIKQMLNADVIMGGGSHVMSWMDVGEMDMEKNAGLAEAPYGSSRLSRLPCLRAR